MTIAERVIERAERYHDRDLDDRDFRQYDLERGHPPSFYESDPEGGEFNEEEFEEYD